MSHREHGARSLANYLLGDAAHQHVCNRASPVRSENDQVDLSLFGITHNLEKRVAVLGDGPCTGFPAALRRDFLELRLGALSQSLTQTIEIGDVPVARPAVQGRV